MAVTAKRRKAAACSTPGCVALAARRSDQCPVHRDGAEQAQRDLGDGVDGRGRCIRCQQVVKEGEWFRRLENGKGIRHVADCERYDPYSED